MAYYGPWEQRPDFERATSSPSVLYARERRTEQSGEVPVREGSHTANSHLSQARQMVAAAAHAPSAGSAVESAAERPFVGVLGRPEPMATYRARVHDPSLGYRPNTQPPPVGTYPEGAIDYEWAAPECSAVAARINWTVFATWLGSLAQVFTAKLGVEAWPGQSLDEPPPSRFPANQLATFTLAHLASTQGSANLTHLLTNQGRLWVAGTMDHGIAEDDYRDAAWPQQRYLYVNGGVGDRQASVVITYTLRPPLFRWVYAEPVEIESPGLPPLRQSPRDDHLGAASAARVWPTSSQQGSLRRHGYF